jgi:hypothetical protein
MNTNDRMGGGASMPPCTADPHCPALAVAGSDRCAVHAQGLRRHHVNAGDVNELRCGRCQRLIRDGEWYRRERHRRTANAALSATEGVNDR